MRTDLLHKYQEHPIGWALRQMSTAGDEETRQTSFIMVITIAELLCWQGEISKAERDWFQAEAARQINHGKVAH